MLQLNAHWDHPSHCAANDTTVFADCDLGNEPAQIEIAVTNEQDSRGCPGERPAEVPKQIGGIWSSEDLNQSLLAFTGHSVLSGGPERLNLQSAEDPGIEGSRDRRVKRGVRTRACWRQKTLWP